MSERIQMMDGVQYKRAVKDCLGYLKQCRVTPTWVANELGVHISMVSNWYRGVHQPSEDNLRKLIELCLQHFRTTLSAFQLHFIGPGLDELIRVWPELPWQADIVAKANETIRGGLGDDIGVFLEEVVSGDLSREHQKREEHELRN